MAKLTQDFTLNKIEKNAYLRDMINSLNRLQDAGAEVLNYFPYGLVDKRGEAVLGTKYGQVELRGAGLQRGGQQTTRNGQVIGELELQVIMCYLC